MRYLAVFLLPFALAAQPAESDKVAQALVSEIQQLRLAIERSTLLNARSQLAIGQLQLQETAVARLSTQWSDVRAQGAASASHRAQLAESLHDAEQFRDRPEFATGPKKDQLEAQIKDEKFQLEQANAIETNRSAREGELSSQLQAAQAQIAESRARIAEMERALDAAIQQLLRPQK